jgi:hypothetical protein
MDGLLQYSCFVSARQKRDAEMSRQHSENRDASRGTIFQKMTFEFYPFSHFGAKTGLGG